MVTASEKVRELVAEGNYKKALSIVKGFRLGIAKDDLTKIKLAYESMTHTRFYEQLGTNTEAAINEGIQILVAHFGQDESMTVDFLNNQE